jgi:Family of unknown function (DUF5677)
MVEQKVQFVGFGFQDFWEHAYKEHEEFLQRVIGLQNALSVLTGRAYQDVTPCQKIILNLAILVGTGMVEVITLVGNGMGQGAMKIVRGLMENAINAEYLRLFPVECNNYLDWHWVEQHKLLTSMRDRAAEVLAEVPAHAQATIEQNFKKVRPRFLDKRRNLRDSWCSLNLADRAAKTGFELSYRVVIPQANQILHGTIGGLNKHFDLTQDKYRIAFPPSDDWGKNALVAAHESTLKVVGTLSKAFGVEPEPSFQSLVEDYDAIWGHHQSEPKTHP